MFGRAILSLIFVFYCHSAMAAEYTLAGFKSKVSKKPPEKVKIYIEDKETGTCKERGAIKTPALVKLMAKETPVFIGVHGDCNLVGFRFSGSRTFWFHIGNVIIDEQRAWDQYLLKIGPNIDCSSGTNEVKLASSGGVKTASSLGFCGG